MPPDGYAWWYLDAFSDDRKYGITIIAFIGSVFSPYYAKQRRHGPAEPLQHCALNVALYGRGGHRWAMTERLPSAVRQETAMLAIGPSAVSWDGTALTVHIDEMTNPIPRRLKGTVRLHPAALSNRAFALDAQARHRWQPMAPSARVEVDLDHPGLKWSGQGYLDTNEGDEPLEHGFTYWNWCRVETKRGAAILYDVVRRNGENYSLALQYDRSGGIETAESPPRTRLLPTLWMVPRETRADAGKSARVVRTLEDTPFYSRSMIASHLYGESVVGMHESLSLNRFRSAWVQALLPYRMPRR